MKRGNSHLARAAGVLMLLAMAGCSLMSGSSSGTSAQTAGAAATPVPYVENCVETHVGSPSKFVCNGKSYTSFQLALIREKEAKKYASGK
jgi:hypothetical protein